MNPFPIPQTVEPAPTAGSRRQIFTVAVLVRQIRLTIEQRFSETLWVEGEVSNFRRPSSGHIYFDLVDDQVTDRRGERLKLPCTFFRGANQQVRFELTDGLKILCGGRVGTYEASGQYQLNVVTVEPRGTGALQLAFEQLKKRLESQGLFAPERKRPIPRRPSRVALITSPVGSVVHDMLSTLRGCVPIVVIPVKVQGDGAAEEIAEGIQTANRLNLADVLIVGRGGGSLEDLWAFNEEPVAQAIYRSRIPVISAVGHEDNWTIADYVADLRAPTPSYAAAIVTDGYREFTDRCQKQIQLLVDGMRAHLDEALHQLEGLAQRLHLLYPIHQLTESQRRAEEGETRLAQLMRHWMQREEHRIQGLAGRLQALSPLAVLARGYSITFQLPDRTVVTDAMSVQPDDMLESRVGSGTILSRVVERQPDGNDP